MTDQFTNRNDWFTATWAMAVWAAHFIVLYGASIVWPGQATARWIAVAVTFLAGAVLLWLWRRAGWPSVFTVAGLGLAIGAAGVAFDFVPAIIG